MDVVGSAAAVVALIELAAKIGSICARYAQTAKHSRDDILRLQNEIQSLQQVLKNGQEIYKTLHDVETATNQYLTSCKDQLEEILAKLEPTSISRFGSRFKLDHFTWPLKKKEVDLLIRNLENTKQTMLLSIQIDQLKLDQSIREAISASSAKLDDIHQSTLDLPIADGASFDSFSDQLNATCHESTRIGLRNEIRSWFEDSDGSCIFWLSGMAGTGKSTVLRSMAQEFHKKNCLGATFFFKHGEGARGNASRFFTTLADQFARNIPGLGVFIREATKANPRVHDQAMAQQIRLLIQEPMVKHSQDRHSSMLVVIDALDECDGEGDAKLLIRLLADLETTTKKRIRILLSSRPETPIRMTFRGMSSTTYISCILHELTDEIDHDIEVYLRDELSKIAEDSLYELPTTWPSDEHIQILVHMAESLFIAAATICRFVGDSRYDPEEQLEHMLSYDKMDHFSPLGVFYQPILDKMVAGLNESQKLGSIHDFRRVVGTIIVCKDALSVAALAVLLEIPKKFIASRLSMLHSVLGVPVQDNHPVRLLHLSFRDFLTMDSQKTNAFWMDQRQLHQNMARQCLRLLSTTSFLKQDICNLQKPDFRRGTIDSALVLSGLPLEVRYACLYWVDHLCNGYKQDHDYVKIRSFLETKLLYWIEALILMGHQPKIGNILQNLRNLCMDIYDSELTAFLGDALDLITSLGSMLDMFPLQIYNSALVFLPESNTIRMAFEHKISDTIKGLPKARNLHDNSSTIHTKYTGYIITMALSPDNAQFATGSVDGSIKLWATATGRLQHILQGHERGVHSVNYAQQGAKLASLEFGDKSMIIIWDLKTVCLEHVIEYGSALRDASISHDSQLLALCLDMQAAEFLDLDTYHRRSINSSRRGASVVRFSSTDEILALASDIDDDIKLLMVRDGSQIGNALKFDQPNASCVSLAFSAQDNLLAAGFALKGVGIWSVNNRHLIFTSDDFHSWNLLFLPDSSRLLCTAGTIEAWDYVNDCLDPNYQGYREIFALSWNGTRIAMVSDTESRLSVRSIPDFVLVQSFEVSRSWHGSLHFLDNDQYLLFSNRSHIQMWDLHSGDLVYTIGNTNAVIESLSFSADGQYLASRTKGAEVVIWHTENGIFLFKAPNCSMQAFAQDSGLVAVVTDNGIELRSLPHGLVVLDIPRFEAGNLRRIELPAGRQQLIGVHSYDQKPTNVIVWDTVTGRVNQHVVLENVSFADNTAVSHNGERLASVYEESDDKTVIQIWSLLTGDLLQTFFTSGSGGRIFYSPSGNHVLFIQGSSLSWWNSEEQRSSADWQFSLPGGCCEFSPFSGDDKQVMVWYVTANTLCILDAVTGILIQKLACTVYPGRMQISEDKEYLETDRGTISLNQQSNSLDEVPIQHVFFEYSWLTVNGQNVLWVPPLYRPVSSSACSGKLALGYASGEVVLYDVVSGSFRSLLLNDDDATKSVPPDTEE